ncbi:hypothetical protein QE382_003189 [Sphingobacterium zeae]|uniref:Uncharacterized protein n=1 Tax=Sphingobacterium zeae TaxID=1776859 RepID=A0ABU0U8B7_9SPHI|nr:hypothetical protein [Sphingobacterium zeae]MDQ1151205.1 hypothetical protein [Sphingobacterium zeae]
MENYRSERLEEMKPKQAEKKELSESESKEALIKPQSRLTFSQSGHLAKMSPLKVNKGGFYLKKYKML